VQTLWTAGKLELLRNEMKRFKYDIIGISEVRWTGKGETPNGDFIWSGEESSHMRGVGFLLSTQAKKALIGYNPISSRIISARFDAAPFKFSVIHVYAPTSSSSEEDIEAFYNDIEVALTKTDKKDITILTGDWNAKIGNDNTDWKSVMGKYGYGDRNERGERLLEFATVHDLYICNTRFQQKPNRKWTWASPDGTASELRIRSIAPLLSRSAARNHTGPASRFAGSVMLATTATSQACPSFLSESRTMAPSA